MGLLFSFAVSSFEDGCDEVFVIQPIFARIKMCTRRKHITNKKSVVNIPVVAEVNNFITKVYSAYVEEKRRISSSFVGIDKIR